MLLITINIYAVAIIVRVRKHKRRCWCGQQMHALIFFISNGQPLKIKGSCDDATVGDAIDKRPILECG